MTPIELNKEECVLVSGGFSREDMMGLKENPTLLSAKVSYIKTTLVNLYRKGFTTYVFTSNGLFDLMVANIINDLNNKGLSFVTVFVKPFPEMALAAGDMFYPEEFAHISFCFCETKEDFNVIDFTNYLNRTAECILFPSRVKNRDAYCIPPGQVPFLHGDRLPN